MVHEKLENLVKVGQLKAEQATADEVAGLIRSGMALRYGIAEQFS